MSRNFKESVSISMSRILTHVLSVQKPVLTLRTQFECTIPNSFVLDQWIVTHVSGSSALRQVSTKISGVLNSQILIFVIVVFKLMYIINKKYASSLKKCFSFRTRLNEKKWFIPEGDFLSQNNSN